MKQETRIKRLQDQIHAHLRHPRLISLSVIVWKERILRKERFYAFTLHYSDQRKDWEVRYPNWSADLPEKKRHFFTGDQDLRSMLFTATHNPKWKIDIEPALLVDAETVQKAVKLLKANRVPKINGEYIMFENLVQHYRTRIFQALGAYVSLPDEVKEVDALLNEMIKSILKEGK